MSPLISGINLSERNAQTLHIRAESARLALLAALFFLGTSISSKYPLIGSQITCN